MYKRKILLMITGIHLQILFLGFDQFFRGFWFPFNVSLIAAPLAVVAPSILPLQVSVILPPIIAGLSRYLRGSGLPRWLNILLALISLLLIGVFCAWLTNGFTNFKDSTLVVLGFVTLIAGGTEMVSLFNYLEINPSPLLAVIPAESQTSPTPVPIVDVTPKPILLSTASRAATVSPSPITGTAASIPTTLDQPLP